MTLTIVVNILDQSESSTPTQAVATFKVDFSALYNTLCKTLHGDQATLFLYMLLHKNIAMKSFILTRTSIDLVVRYCQSSMANALGKPVFIIGFV